MSIAVHRKFDEPTTDLANSSVLVTGGTGSFGRALIRELLSRTPPRRLIVFSRGELNQERMSQELQAAYPRLFDRLRFFIGDVRDVARLELAMREVEIVVHAAALKIVPIAEYNPFECVM